MTRSTMPPQSLAGRAGVSYQFTYQHDLSQSDDSLWNEEFMTQTIILLLNLNIYYSQNQNDFPARIRSN